MIKVRVNVVTNYNHKKNEDRSSSHIHPYEECLPFISAFCCDMVRPLFGSLPQGQVLQGLICSQFALSDLFDALNTKGIPRQDQAVQGEDVKKICNSSSGIVAQLIIT